MARRKKGNLRLVKAKPRKPRKPPRCKAKTRAGKRCLRRAVKRGACGLKAHQDQVRGVKSGTFGRRQPANAQISIIFPRSGSLTAASVHSTS